MSPPLDRRSLLRLIAAALAAPAAGSVAAAAPPAPAGTAAAAAIDTAALARALGLRPPEIAWLDDLDADDRRALYEALASPGERPVAKTVDLLVTLLGRRSRVFAYIDYPAAADIRSLCDGLLRE